MFIADLLIPKVIYQGSTKYNEDIKVIKVGKTYKLIVNGIVQSFNNNSHFAKGKVWGQIVKIIGKEKTTAKKILLLGMGGGTMVHMLNKKYSDLNITSVEIDQTIVDLAIQYFDLDSIKNNRVIVADAFDVVLNPKKYKISKGFDCVVVDTYLGGEYPTNMSTEKFLKGLFNLVDNDGFVIVNRIIYKDQINNLPKQFENILQPYMRQVKIKKVKYPTIADNYIFYGFKK